MPIITYLPKEGMPNTRYNGGYKFNKGENNPDPKSYNKIMEDPNCKQLFDQGVLVVGKPKEDSPEEKPKEESLEEKPTTFTSKTAKSSTTTTVTPVEAK